MAGMIELWRIEKEIFVSSARTGEGARIAGGRWNSPGLSAIYCGESLALCIVEILVHASTPEERVDPRVRFRLHMPSTAITGLGNNRLPRGWNDPLIHPKTVALGDAWLRSLRSVALRVPSAVVPGAWNYILNPAHPQFKKRVHWAKPLSLKLDPRLIDVASA
ncbi:MAG: hypothetical protein JWM32_2576 [Verrucomicrobia bacterium]|nr:hypothetical protein [Verrucomicrobiota bacterium]